LQWRDTEVHVFGDPETLHLIPGEFPLATVTPVMDVTVLPGRSGQLHITNIQLVWYIPCFSNINASIGYQTLVGSSVVNGVQSGAWLTEVLMVQCKDNNTMYLFMFNAARADPSVFGLFDRARANYPASSVLREQKLRSSLIQEGNLVMVDGEQVMLSLDGFANFSSDVANVGRAIVTNIRSCGTRKSSATSMC
jgi:Bardet-Biedl syndrome 5 protein